MKITLKMLIENKINKVSLATNTFMPSQYRLYVILTVNSQRHE